MEQEWHNPYAIEHIRIAGVHAVFAIFDCEITYSIGIHQICEGDYILAFRFFLAPKPRYFERASLNFHVMSSEKVRRAGLYTVRSR